MALGSYLWDSWLIQIRTVKHQTETVVNIYSRYLDVHQVTVIPLYKFVSMTTRRQGMLSLHWKICPNHIISDLFFIMILKKYMIFWSLRLLLILGKLSIVYVIFFLILPELVQTFNTKQDPTTTQPLFLLVRR